MVVPASVRNGAAAGSVPSAVSAMIVCAVDSQLSQLLIGSESSVLLLLRGKPRARLCATAVFHPAFLCGVWPAPAAPSP